MIRFVCGHCGHRLKALFEDAGKKIRCTRCAATQRVPATGRESDGGLSGTRTDVDVLKPPTSAAAKAPAQPEFAVVAEEEVAPVKFKRRVGDDNDLDMTPMVDCVFQLLIFFMITAAFAQQKSIQVPTPDRNEGATQSRMMEDPQDDYVIVRIDRDGTIWVNDSEAPSKQEVIAKLREAREGPAGSDSPGPSRLMVIPDLDAPTERIVLVLDAGTDAGMEGIKLAPPSDEE